MIKCMVKKRATSNRKLKRHLKHIIRHPISPNGNLTSFNKSKQKQAN
ncbi:hypothetical protein PD280_12760 [Virgibacillus salarius]|nr:hypothetical protein [Virgibacillus salarius]WBX78734.1 hypothetical protein PD280_12760 [Virgibacillus salarius]